MDYLKYNYIFVKSFINIYYNILFINNKIYYSKVENPNFYSLLFMKYILQ